jgi:hypothetical protein
MGAEIRASYTKSGLHQLRREHAQTWEPLVAAVGDGPLQEVRSASNLAWLPAELHGLISDAMIDVAGRDRARALWASVILEAFSSRMLGPIVSGALRLYGKTPSSVMRMTPHAWPLIFRECGRSWMEPIADDRATMLFTDLPRAIIASTGILDSFLGNCDAALQYTGYKGEVNASYEGLALCTFSIAVQWQLPSPAERV